MGQLFRGVGRKAMEERKLERGACKGDQVVEEDK